MDNSATGEKRVVLRGHGIPTAGLQAYLRVRHFTRGDPNYSLCFSEINFETLDDGDVGCCR